MSPNKSLKELNTWIKENPKEFNQEVLKISNMIKKEQDKIPKDLNDIPYVNHEKYINGCDVQYGLRKVKNSIQFIIFYILGEDSLVIDNKEIILEIQYTLAENNYINYFSMHGNHLVEIIDKT